MQQWHTQLSWTGNPADGTLAPQASITQVKQAGEQAAPAYGPHLYTLTFAVACIALGLAVLWYLLRQLMRHKTATAALHQASTADGALQLTSTSDGAEMQVVTMRVPPAGLPQAVLAKLPVVKYHSMRCKQTNVALVKLGQTGCTGTPVCRHTAHSRWSEPTGCAEEVAAAAAAAAGQHHKLNAAIAEETPGSKAVTSPSAAAGSTSLTSAAAATRTRAAGSTSSTGVAEPLGQVITSSMRAGMCTLQRLSGSLSWGASSPHKHSSSGRRSNRTSNGGNIVRRHGSTASTGAGQDDDMCAICFEEFNANDDVKLLPCQHFIIHPALTPGWHAMTHAPCARGMS